MRCGILRRVTNVNGFSQLCRQKMNKLPEQAIRMEDIKNYLFSDWGWMGGSQTILKEEAWESICSALEEWHSPCLECSLL